MLAPAKKMGGSLADKGRLYEWKMSGIIAGDIGVIVGQIRSDQFAVNPFKVIVGLSVHRVAHKVEISCAHTQGA